VVLLRSFLGFFISYTITETLFIPHLPEEFRVDVFDSFVEIYLHGLLDSRSGPAE
jgi:hypothetical protein